MRPFPPSDMTLIVEKGYGQFMCRRHVGPWDFRWRDDRWEWYSKTSRSSSCLYDQGMETLAWLQEGQGMVNYRDKQ
jgi:hypothetical protein